MSANIEALVKKHIARNGAVVEILHDALTEQAEAFKGELSAYDGMVRELTKTVEDMQAAQSVPVVGDAVAWVVNTPIRILHFSKSEEIGLGGATQELLYRAPTHSITAAELATLREKAARFERELETERMRLNSMCSRKWYIAWTREGEHCRVFKRGDYEDDATPVCGWKTFFTTPREAIDAAIAQGKGE